MNKRGVTEEVLYDMFKLLISVFLFVILAGIAWQLFFTKELTLAQRNLDTVVAEIQALSPGEKFEAIAVTNFKLILFNTNNDERRCAGKPCVCAVEPAQQGKPETWYCKTLADVGTDCDKGACAPPGPLKTVDVTKDAPIVICRAGQYDNTLMIGAECG